MSSGSGCDRFFPETLHHLILFERNKIMHELCRFAGLFSLGPAKNTRFFH